VAVLVADDVKAEIVAHQMRRPRMPLLMVAALVAAATLPRK
jgi:hypothetical protein